MSPLPQSQFHQQAPIQHTAPRAWHEEFARQHSQPTLNHQIQQRALRGSNNCGVYSNNLNAINHLGMPSTRAQQNQPEKHFSSEYDQVDMEQAFEAVAIQQHHSLELSPPIDLARDFIDMHPSEENRIRSDTILTEASKDEQKHTGKDDADELARTAGQLLDNVIHEQSQKFQDSSFLSLMRQIRDREVHIEGDKLVNVSTP